VSAQGAAEAQPALAKQAETQQFAAEQFVVTVAQTIAELHPTALNHASALICDAAVATIWVSSKREQEQASIVLLLVKTRPPNY
jgi:hypothetical protein